MNIRVFDIQYSIQQLAIEVYVAGCTRHCPGCHNPETWDFAGGAEIDSDWLQSLERSIQCGALVDKIWILGGEPLDQNPREFEALVNCLYNYKLPLWLFTSYELEDVPATILPYFDYIKTGRYEQDNPTIDQDSKVYGVHLASANQTIYKKGIDYLKED